MRTFAKYNSKQAPCTLGFTALLKENILILNKILLFLSVNCK